jgi:glycerophosphoryl diester phosphodiesterase
LNADGFALQAAQVTPDFIREVHARNKPAYVWTVDDPGQMENFIEMDVDYLYTNDPAKLMALLQRRAALDPGAKLRQKFKRLLAALTE